MKIVPASYLLVALASLNFVACSKVETSAVAAPTDVSDSIESSTAVAPSAVSESTTETRLWQQTHATRLEGGGFEWAPRPFNYQASDSVCYIDYESGSDANDGLTPATPFKHHPWDASATKNAASTAEVQNYVFKGGVTYRGRIVASESGSASKPIRLTRDPNWGEGPAILQGSEAIEGGWKQVSLQSAPKHLPNPDKVWAIDLDVPNPIYSLWMTDQSEIVRISRARTPNWTHETWDDVHSTKAVWKDVIAVKGEKRHLPDPIIGADQAWASDPEVFNDPDPNAYEGAIVWTEYAGLMGSPYATQIEEYNPETNAVRIGAPWTGDRKPIARCRYFVEGLARFLDVPGEFHHDQEAGRLYVRLPNDIDPNTVRIEVPQRTNIIDLSHQRHIEVSGLLFRFQRTHNVYTRYWDEPSTDAQAISVMKYAEGIRIANNRFEHLVYPVWVATTEFDQHIKDVLIEDNDFYQCDRNAIMVSAAGYKKGGSNGPIDRVTILRNRIAEIGVRPRRAEHGHTIDINYATEVIVAGNILNKTYGAGIFIYGGKRGGDKSEIPFGRILVFQNQVTDSNLASNDWGGIETWQGGPAYVFDNISLNPGGYWHAFDFIQDDTFLESKREMVKKYPHKGYSYVVQAMAVAGIFDRGERNAYSARFAYALYMDGAFKQYWFNNIAGGNESDPQSSLVNTGGIHAVGGSFMNAVFNNTFYRFGLSSARGGTFPAPNLMLGNIMQDTGDQFLRHERARANPNESLIRLPDADPEGFAKGADSITLMEAIGENLFHGQGGNFGTFERSGKMWPDIDSFRDAFQRYAPLAGGIGEVVETPLLRDPSNGDYRPALGSPAEGHGTQVFVPWGLYGTVGEWGFYHLAAEPSRIVGEHWFMTEEHIDRGMYRRLPRHDLTAVNVSSADYTSGILEDWTQGALKLNGVDQYLTFPHAQMIEDIHWKDGKKQRQFAGDRRRTVDMATNSFTVEAVLRVDAEWKGGQIVSKANQNAGYRLQLNDQRQVELLLLSGGSVVYQATTDVSLNDDWQHVLVELDRANGAQFYLNGSELASRVTGALPGPMVSLANDGDFFAGRELKATFDFLRVSRGTLADARTTIEELYEWQTAGPQTRTWTGVPIQ